MLHEKLKEAVRAFMEFSKSVLREFSIRHMDTIVDYLADIPDVRNAAHTLKVFARPFLENRQFDKVSNWLDCLTSNFPSVLKEVKTEHGAEESDGKPPFSERITKQEKNSVTLYFESVNEDKMVTLKSKTAKVIYAVIACILVNSLWGNAWHVYVWLKIQGGTILSSFVRDLVMTIAVLLGTYIVIQPKEICSFLGLNSNFFKGFLIAVLSVLPLYIVFPIIGSINPDLTLSLIIRKSLFPGFIEEFMCRAFMFGLFFRYAKVGFLWATLLPAVLFGLAHTYQGDDLISSLAAFGVTFIGALYFSWMYTAWNFNLWVVFGLHFLMNAAWGIFNVTGTEVAAGGLISNIVRIVSIALAIGITIYYHKKKGENVFDYPIWSF
ncbi:MAG: CPBP family intramembrane metalloprotease [Bacteroidales bacterium]|nr:CPBP family intramembrane metalloprotease [Bacteroidales bacterium]